MLEAVEACLAHRLSIPIAARSIPVHVNTLRCRLLRFSELTGADLGYVDTLIELSWVLAARRGDPRS
ncbi:helix-turn-helix domain-containing protein [Citricoccus muralis]|uniref:Helix-turn-helix domain-containing protein n=1 Tax=Citricoccus muralis TaxID=169134 RepID=A0ABY8H5G4_9MICC|nr:helix-turn-helix domain-containing protein [Citricoccus muralis]WFP16261.1 helix-turn-helix domain-containing protein [Citricoccus muralis]